MKRIGFTLAELLITLGIISIVATLTAPTLINAIPDKDKVQVIKLHNVISNITRDLLDNPSYYRDEECNADGHICAGLASTGVPLIDYIDANNYSGDIKYPRLLAERLHTTSQVTGVSLPITFETLDGVSWSIALDTASAINTDTDEYEIKYEITVDIKSNIGSTNCSAGATNCKKPDSFIFLVDTHGKVTGKDVLTEQYLKTSTKLNNKKEDYNAVGL